MRIAPVIASPSSLRRASNTSSDSSARWRPASSRSRCRCRCSARMMNGYPRSLRDSSPVAILTTSAVVDDVDSCTRALSRAVCASSDRDRRARPRYAAGLPLRPATPQTKTALLQYTSGSTRQPAGVVVTHKNIIANLNQMISDYFEHMRKLPATGHHARVVAALLSRHGPSAGHLRTRLRRASCRGDKLRWRFCRSPPGGSSCWPTIRERSRPRPISRSNWRRDAHPTTTWPASTWATCSASSAAANASTRRRSVGSPSGSPASTFPTPLCCRPTGWPKPRCM